jgi:hypothetical protein
MSAEHLEPKIVKEINLFDGGKQPLSSVRLKDRREPAISSNIDNSHYKTEGSTTLINVSSEDGLL